MPFPINKIAKIQANAERKQSIAEKIIALRKDPDAPKNFGQHIARSDGQTVDLYIYDVIGWPWIEAQDIVDAVPKDVTEINLHINSPGGSVFEGTAIYNWLKNHSAKINVYIDGLAASMASIIAMVGQTIIMPRSAFFMIHDPWALMIGTAEDLRKEADLLDKIETVMSEIYAERSGKDLGQIRGWMHQETWFTGLEAIEAGFADQLDGNNPDTQAAQAMFDLSIFDRAPGKAPDRKATPQTLQRAASARVNNIKTEEEKMNPELRKLLEAKGLAKDATDEQALQFMKDLLARGDLSSDDQKKIRSEERKAEKTRQKEIRQAVRLAGLKEAFAEELIENDTTLDAAREKIFAKMAETNPPIGAGRIQSGETENEKFKSAAVDALVMRAGLHIEKPTAGAKQLMGYEIAQIIRESLMRSGHDVSSLHSRRMVADFVFNSRQMTMTTSDFPEIFRDAANKTLQKSYEEIPVTYPAWTNRVPATDFKDMYNVSLSEAPDLDLVSEAGEYKYGDLKDSAEKYRVFKYGKIVKLTFESIVNDDLRAFTRLPRLLGSAARRKENELVYSLLTSGSNNHGPTMSDNRQLFKTTVHKNLLQTGRAITAENLDAARQLMRAQKGLKGSRLNIEPRFLLVSPKKEMVTDVLLRSAASVTDDKNSGVLNPMQGKFVSIVEPYLLDVFSGLGWYIIADPAQFDTFEVAYLDGYEQPQIMEREAFTSDAIEWKIRHFFGVGAMEFRTLVLNDGTA
ncbi:ClpP-like prohead protease/major capsid protein fusion protein [Desulfonatronovibrio hydrogenovorans]|uniref:ClpP-like prohead protease/major capsid protein fusion protein n=1 Tax=Desulfonatronovibrio hydrogenovorans TaxID=53245 RepID=UPI00068DA57C|nr:ClpP-like prohead protease/major capsid protein fusion protein [Desulfonatronovibrio hydrogenovorans]